LWLMIDSCAVEWNMKKSVNREAYVAFQQYSSEEGGMELNDWMAQIRKGTLDMVVLSVLRGGEKYGLEIINLLKEDFGLEMAEGTLYPLLNRMRKDGAVVAKWDHNAGTGHPRKYYSLTKSGRELATGMHRQWRSYANMLEGIISNRTRKSPAQNAKEA